MERQGVVTLKGGPITLMGAEVRVGQKANDFSVLDNELKVKTLADALRKGGLKF